MHGPLPDTAAFSSVFRGFINKLRTAARIEVPVGYEDETGFPTAVKPAEKEIW